MHTRRCSVSDWLTLPIHQLTSLYECVVDVMVERWGMHFWLAADWPAVQRTDAPCHSQRWGLSDGIGDFRLFRSDGTENCALSLHHIPRVWYDNNIRFHDAIKQVCQEKNTLAKLSLQGRLLYSDNKLISYRLYVCKASVWVSCELYWAEAVGWPLLLTDVRLRESLLISLITDVMTTKISIGFKLWLLWSLQYL